MEAGKCLWLAGVFCFVLVIDFAVSVDSVSERNYDSEIEDEIDDIDDSERLRSDYQFDAFDLRSLVESEDDREDDFMRELEKQESEENLQQEFHRDVERNTLTARISNILQDVGKKYKINHAFQTKGKCSTFKARSHTVHNCSTVKTFLGDVIACLVTCSDGYHLLRATPYHELCGAPTEWRWTYQLRGDSQAGETCKKGATTKKPPTACTDANCYATAAYYMNKIDYSVDPCDDFFEYSCGRWLDETSFGAASQGIMMTYYVIRTRVKKDVSKVLAKPVRKSDISSVKKAKILYQSCMNIGLINKLDSKPLLNFLKGHLTWPVISKTWKNSQFDLEATLAELRGKYHNNIMFTIKVAKNSGSYILQTWKGKTALPEIYFFDKKYADRKAAYFSLMKDIAIMLGADKMTAHRDMTKVLKFEEAIALLKVIDTDYLSQKTISAMEKDIPGINWLKLFKRMIRTAPITSGTNVEVWNVNYLKDMIRIIAVTDKRVVQNYMVWRIVKHRILNLGRRFEERYLEFEHALYGTRALYKRWYKCALYLIYAMKGPTGKLFVDTYFSPSNKKNAEDMFNNIQNGFIHLLNTEVDWMDAKTKGYAKKKALAIKANIGYNPHIYENKTYLNGQWDHLVVKRKDYFGNVLQVLTQISQNGFKKLTETYNVLSHKSFTTRATMVNALYSPADNTITLPAGEMQYPFYWGDKFPRMFQYGAIGTILGHEITHGFDNNGALRGIHGNLKDWWTARSWRQFEERVTCMVNQYSNYYWEAAGEYLDGTKTISENIADNGGIRESYQGYQIWLKKHNLTGEAIEPATGLTNNQMFFVGFANVRCAKYTHKAAVDALATFTHSPGRFRVIGSLQNFDKFSEAFNCPLKSYMNPKKKCIIW